MENSTIDSWARSGQRANTKIGSSKVQLAMRTPPLIIGRTHIVPGTGNRETVSKLIKKAGEFWKNIYFCFIDYAKAFACVDQNKLWKISKDMGIPNHLTCLVRNLYAGQEATVRTGHGTTDWFQIGKGLCQGCILSSCLFNLYAEYIMRNPRLDEAQARIKIDNTTLMAESEKN